MRELSIQELAFVSGGRNCASNGSVIGGNGGSIIQATGSSGGGTSLNSSGQSTSISNTNVNTSGTALGLNLSL